MCCSVSFGTCRPLALMVAVLSAWLLQDLEIIHSELRLKDIERLDGEQDRI